jgi:hypothetical protein
VVDQLVLAPNSNRSEYEKRREKESQLVTNRVKQFKFTTVLNGHYDKTFKDFSYNINKCDITYMFF